MLSHPKVYRVGTAGGSYPVPPEVLGRFQRIPSQAPFPVHRPLWELRGVVRYSLHGRSHTAARSFPLNLRRRWSSTSARPERRRYRVRGALLRFIGHDRISLGVRYKDAFPGRGGCVQALVSSRCSAWRTLVSVSFAPLSMRAISSTRSTRSMRCTEVSVRPRFSDFAMRKCWSAKAAICGR